MEAKGADQYPHRRKIAMLLSAIEPEALERYNHFEWVIGDDNPEDKKDYDHVIAKFEKELTGMKRLVFTRFQFWDHM